MYKRHSISSYFESVNNVLVYYYKAIQIYLYYIPFFVFPHLKCFFQHIKLRYYSKQFLQLQIWTKNVLERCFYFMMKHIRFSRVKRFLSIISQNIYLFSREIWSQNDVYKKSIQLVNMYMSLSQNDCQTDNIY